jgi:hypothetical protein
MGAFRFVASARRQRLREKAEFVECCGEGIPQGLKPPDSADLIGMAEAVPYQSRIRIESLRSP